MAISFYDFNSTTVTTLNGSANLAIPVGVAVGDMVVLEAWQKISTSSITGFSGGGGSVPEIVAGLVGTGADGAGAGQVRVAIHAREVVQADLDGTIFSITVASNNVTRYQMMIYKKDSAEVWATPLSGGTGSDTSSDTSWSWTGSNPSAIDGDLIVFVDATTTQVSPPTGTATATGATLTYTSRLAGSTASGNDVGYRSGDATVTGTTSSGVTRAGTLGSASTGGGAYIRLRVSNPNIVVADASHAHAADNVAVTQVHNLVIQEATHAHTADSCAVAQNSNVQVADAQHSHWADNVAVVQRTVLFYASTPIREPYQWGDDGLLKFYKIGEGTTWWKVGSDWFSGNYREDTVAEGATEVYRGGYDHLVSAAKAAELEALGFTIRQEAGDVV